MLLFSCLLLLFVRNNSILFMKLWGFRSIFLGFYLCLNLYAVFVEERMVGFVIDVEMFIVKNDLLCSLKRNRE